MKFIVLSALALSLGGCATVTRGTTNQVQIVSEPAGAEARTSLGHACVTPCTITVSRRDEFSVIVSKQGYESASIPVRTQLAGAGAAGLAGNVLAGGIIGIGVDAATGSTLEHVPNPVSVVLSRSTPAAAPPAQGRRPPARPAPPAPQAPTSAPAPGV